MNMKQTFLTQTSEILELFLTQHYCVKKVCFIFIVLLVSYSFVDFRLV